MASFILITHTFNQIIVIHKYEHCCKFNWMVEQKDNMFAAMSTAYRKFTLKSFTTYLRTTVSVKSMKTGTIKNMVTYVDIISYTSRLQRKSKVCLISLHSGLKMLIKCALVFIYFSSINYLNAKTMPNLKHDI